VILVFLGKVVLLEVVGVLGLEKDVVLAEEEAHLVVEEDLDGVVGEEKHRSVLAAAVLGHRYGSFLL
jgi:hypothetical protein